VQIAEGHSSVRHCVIRRLVFTSPHTDTLGARRGQPG
jgi:hypothetical protein